MFGLFAGASAAWTADSAVSTHARIGSFEIFMSSFTERFSICSLQLSHVANGPNFSSGAGLLSYPGQPQGGHDQHALSIAQSGLASAQFQLSVTADNIANSDTPGYKSKSVDLIDEPGGGVAIAGVTEDPSPGPTLPDGTQGSNVDLATEAVNLIQSRLLYSANAVVIKTADQMYGSLLNILDNGHRRGND